MKRGATGSELAVRRGPLLNWPGSKRQLLESTWRNLTFPCGVVFVTEMGMLSSYSCTAVQEGSSIKILSVCRICGASRVVSVSDGSLEEWQRTHECAVERRPPRPVLVPQKQAKKRYFRSSVANCDRLRLFYGEVLRAFPQWCA